MKNCTKFEKNNVIFDINSMSKLKNLRRSSKYFDIEKYDIDMVSDTKNIKKGRIYVKLLANKRKNGKKIGKYTIKTYNENSNNIPNKSEYYYRSDQINDIVLAEKILEFIFKSYKIEDNKYPEENIYCVEKSDLKKKVKEIRRISNKPIKYTMLLRILENHLKDLQRK